MTNPVARPPKRLRKLNRINDQKLLDELIRPKSEIELRPMKKESPPMISRRFESIEVENLQTFEKSAVILFEDLVKYRSRNEMCRPCLVRYKSLRNSRKCQRPVTIKRPFSEVYSETDFDTFQISISSNHTSLNGHDMNENISESKSNNPFCEFPIIEQETSV